MQTVKLNVSFNFQQLLDTIKQLSPKEKMEVNDALWEENMDIPMEHQALVLERIENSKKNPGTIRNWDEAKKKLRHK
jgi:uncharacterized protein (DUF1697 family)